MKSSRRSFLKTSGACGCAALVQQLLRPSVLFAQAACAGGTGHHIVHIVLDGAHDGLYMFPFLDASRYSALQARRAPVMQARGSGVSFGHSIFGVHPLFDVRVEPGSLSVRDMLENGEARVVSCVGMPLDKRSHPECMNSLMAGLPAASSATGTQWLARLMDTCGFTPYQVFRMGTTPGLSLERSSGGPPPIDINVGLKNFDWDDNGDVELRRATSVLQQILSLQQPTTDHERALVTTMAGIYDAIPRIKDISNVSVSGKYSGYYPSGGVTYFDAEGQLFADTARVLKYNEDHSLKSFVQMGFWDFDHHSDMPNRLSPRIERFNRNLSQLRADLGPSIWAKTVVIISSEMGRSLKGSNGTEHGFGNITLVLGGGFSGVSDRVVGRIPSVQELSLPDPDALNGKFTPLPMYVDYRQLFSEALMWMGVDPAPVFPGFVAGSGGSLGLFGVSSA